MACLWEKEPASQSAWRQVKAVKGRSRSESESEEGVESRGLDPKPSELSMARMKRGDPAPWRSEPVSGAKGWDELWIEVKSQPSSEIAGSPRNAFRCSPGLLRSAGRGRHEATLAELPRAGPAPARRPRRRG